jgi:hypothetical protein
MMRLIKVMIVLFFVSASSCISDIDLQAPADVDRLLAIQAQLTKGSPHVFFASIAKVFDFGGRSAPIRVRSVTLANELGQELIIPNTDTEEYRLEIPTDSEFVIEDFMTFNLEVVTSDGRVYTSSFEQLLPVAQVEQLDVEIITELEQQETIIGGLEEVEKLQISVTSPATVPTTNDLGRFRWTFEEVYRQSDTPPDGSDSKTCYVTQGIGATVETTFDPTLSGVTRIENLPIFVNNIFFNYAEGNYFIALQQSLTPTAFTYFNSVSEVISREASIFNSPAGRVQSNFTNLDDPNDEVFGYFFATSIDTARIFISPEMAGSPRNLCPVTSMRPTDCPSAACCDCLDQEASTLDRPVWWL